MIKQKSNDQETSKIYPSVFPTVLIILSGLILYLDKIFVFFDVQLENNHGYQQTEEFIWSLSQTLSPIIIVIGLYLKPFKEALIVPLFCYVIQLWFVLDSSLTVDRPLTWVYVLGTVVFIVIISVGIKRILIRRSKLLQLRESVMEKIVSKDDQLLTKKEHGK